MKRIDFPADYKALGDTDMFLKFILGVIYSNPAAREFISNPFGPINAPVVSRNGQEPT